MRHRTDIARRALGSLAAGGAAAVASLALAGAASAAIITVSPDGTTGTDHLTAAINTANTNTDASNTIILQPGKYTPQLSAGASLVIKKNLTITGDHALQATGGIPGTEISGSKEGTTTSDIIVINSGVSVVMEGINIDGVGASGFAGVRNNGTLQMFGVTMSTPGGIGLATGTGSTTTLNESTFFGAIGQQIQNNGKLTLNSTTVASGNQGAIANNSPATFTLNNSLLANQTGAECTGGTTTGGVTSFADDNTCGVPNDPNVALTLSYALNTNGGPTSTAMLPSNAYTTGKGSSCPTTDQRFFANPKDSLGNRTCDIGAVTNSGSAATSATRDTVNPTCTVTRTAYPPAVTAAQQDVTVKDAGAGLGPELGTFTDPQPTGTINPADAITNLSITNGSVAMSPANAFNPPSNGNLVLTATKQTAGVKTVWNFTATDWAGNSVFCN